VPWTQIAGLLPRERVGGLAYDVQGGFLCVSTQNGVGFISAMNGHLMDDVFLDWYNPWPETLEADLGGNSFSARQSETHHWQLGLNPYLAGKDESVAIRIAVSDGTPGASTWNPCTGWRAC